MLGLLFCLYAVVYERMFTPMVMKETASSTQHTEEPPEQTTDVFLSSVLLCIIGGIKAVEIAGSHPFFTPALLLMAMTSYLPQVQGSTNSSTVIPTREPTPRPSVSSAQWSAVNNGRLGANFHRAAQLNDTVFVSAGMDFNYPLSTISRGLVSYQSLASGRVLDSYGVRFGNNCKFSKVVVLNGTAFFIGVSITNRYPWFVKISPDLLISRSYVIKSLVTNAAIFDLVYQDNFLHFLVCNTQMYRIKTDSNLNIKSAYYLSSSVYDPVSSFYQNSFFYAGLIASIPYKGFLMREGAWSFGFLDPSKNLAVIFKSLDIDNDIIYVGGAMGSSALVGMINASSGKAISLKLLAGGTRASLINKVRLKSDGNLMAVGYSMVYGPTASSGPNGWGILFSPQLAIIKAWSIGATPSNVQFNDLLRTDADQLIAVGITVNFQYPNRSAFSITINPDFSVDSNILPSGMQISDITTALNASYVVANITQAIYSFTKTSVTPTLVEVTNNTTTIDDVLSVAWLTGKTTYKPTGQPTVFPTKKPSGFPSLSPTKSPSRLPTSSPTLIPTLTPTSNPTAYPTQAPTYTPSFAPTLIPTNFPTVSPSRFPTIMPTCFPTNEPSLMPSVIPTFLPSGEPTFIPTILPTDGPTLDPSTFPSFWPSSLPTMAPTYIPTYIPTIRPSSEPSAHPSEEPTGMPTLVPTLIPTNFPTVSPTRFPTIMPSCFPTNEPSLMPSVIPTFLPSGEPTFIPTILPTDGPTLDPSTFPSSWPSSLPTMDPTRIPTFIPTIMPTGRPTFLPSLLPTNMPTLNPSMIPTVWPTCLPTNDPTRAPTLMPTMVPSCEPTSSPTAMPTRVPTLMPTLMPTDFPTLDPTQLPTTWPSSIPTNHPSFTPTLSPTIMPSGKPSLIPTLMPSVMPSGLPTYPPTYWPSNFPSPGPSFSPTWLPSVSPSGRPTWMPTYLPSNGPSILPTAFPSYMPSVVPTDFPSFSPATIDTYLYQSLAFEILARQQEYTQVAKLLSNETVTRQMQLSFVQSGFEAQQTVSLIRLTNATHALATLNNDLKIIANLNASSLFDQWLIASILNLQNETQQKNQSNTALIATLQQKNQQCRDDHQALLMQLYMLTQHMQQRVHALNESFNRYINSSDDAFTRLANGVHSFSVNTDQQFVDSDYWVTQNLSFTNASVHQHVYALWLALKQDLDSVASFITQEANAEIKVLQTIIDSVRPASANSTKTYAIPATTITDILTNKIAAIHALDNPQVQQARNILDTVISYKELTLICIALFNFLVLVQGMSAIQSLRYRFRLKDKQELDALRRGTAGPVGPDFYTFITRLESIIVHSNFTKKERLDCLAKLAEIQQMKNNSLSLFSSLDSLSELRTELKRVQELCAVGLLREVDLFRKIVADHTYNSFIPWRRVNHIRTLIYTVLRPYVGSIEDDDKDVLGRREHWSSRHQHREKIAQQWQLFRARLPDQASMPTPKMASPTAIMLKMLTEFDQKASPALSRYFHKLHAKLCLLSYFPSLVDDLSRIAFENNFRDDSKRYLKDARDLMADIYRLSKPCLYGNIRRFSLMQTEAENIARQSIAHRLHTLFKAVVEHIEYAIPLLTAWMNAYDTIAGYADTPLKKHLMLVSDQIDQTTEESTDEYQQKYYDMMDVLSSDLSLSGLVDLIDLSYHLERKVDQCHLSPDVSHRRRVAPELIDREEDAHFSDSDGSSLSSPVIDNSEASGSSGSSGSSDSSDSSDSNSSNSMKIVSFWYLSSSEEDIDESFRKMMEEIWRERSSSSEDDQENRREIRVSTMV